MTRGTAAQSCSSGGLTLLSRPGQRAPRPVKTCETRTRLQGALHPGGTLLREGCAAPAAQGPGPLRGAAQPDLPGAVRAALGVAPAPKWVPNPQNGQSWGPTGSVIARRAPQGLGRVGVRRPHPGAPWEPEASVQFTGRWVCVPASLRRRWVGGRGGQSNSRMSECARPGPDP